ncbi:CAMK/RAD53 protein kinase [Favolaschia claudopus]|uniref:CAMK/RAD53 protein kinase n=1 Tax=Favolaschia claudopus TaxID=2862362 RepID=A0AAW0C014_9AGAR
MDFCLDVPMTLPTFITRSFPEPKSTNTAPVASTSKVEIAEVWGYLEPLVPGPKVHRINLINHRVDIGRGEENYVKFDSRAVSKAHATIQWNGRSDWMSVVTITDHNTTNGTFVDGAKVEGINVRRLFDGCSVFFGCLVPVVGEEEDYRYTFHHAFGRSKNESVFRYYIVGDRLGGGLHGHVHRCMERSTGQMFAVKTAWAEDGMDTVACAGQEAMALMSLEHINVVLLQEVFFHMTGNTVDIVLEYVDGPNLDTLLRRNRLSENQAKELSFQLCRGVAYIHEALISHGDLKLDNVLVTLDYRPRIKIIDFGLARVQNSYNMFPIITDHIFTAPESQPQGRTEKPIYGRMSRKWDDWGLGCIIFNLLASRHPFIPEFIQEAYPFDPRKDKIEWDVLQYNSEAAQDLMRKLLVVDPAVRIGSSETLKHAWLAGHRPYHVSFDEIDFSSEPVEAVIGEGMDPNPPRALVSEPVQRDVRRLRSGRVVPVN